MSETLDLKIEEAWNEAVTTWNSPTVPNIIVLKTQEEIKQLGEIGSALQGELAFMHYPNFQTYAIQANIESKLAEDPQRGAKAILKHELGHRFCPYDTVTSIILKHAVKKELEGKKLPYDSNQAANLVLNLYSDMTINTRLRKDGDKDIPWVYQQLSKAQKNSKLWNVYGRSMELAWGDEILPEDTEVNEEQARASQEIADLFEEDFFNRARWKNNIRTFTRNIIPFLEEESKDKSTTLDDHASNLPKTLDEKTTQELAKRLSEIGSNGLPTNPSGLKEFKEIMAGYGQGDPKKASIAFYDRLSDSYDVRFATRPFGRPRVNPFQPVKWTPSMDVSKLDVDYSVQIGGRIIPGVNTYSWNTRRREAFGGLEEVIPNMDLYLDSSGSMPNPLEQISLPVLAGFVVAKKAHRKGASIRSTNFSGQGQYKTQESTRDLDKIYDNLVIHYNGGTVFPTNALLEGRDPRQVLVITDTFVANEQDSSQAIRDLRKRHKGNKVAIYALHPIPSAEYLKGAGAEIIHGTTTDIFKRVIGKADEVYQK